MNRVDILVYLQEDLSELAEKLSQPITDTSDGYKLPIDSALRRIGVVDLVSPSIASDLEESVLALAEYHALLRFWKAVSARTDTNTNANFTVGRSQLFLQVKDLLATSADACALLGYPVIASDQGPSVVAQTKAVSVSVPTKATW